VATSELVWLETLLASVGTFHKQPMKFFCDSYQSTLHTAKKTVFHECTKHIGMGCYFLCEKLQHEILTLSCMVYYHQPTNIFAKVPSKIIKLSQKQNVNGKLACSNSSNLRGSDKNNDIFLYLYILFHFPILFCYNLLNK